MPPKVDPKWIETKADEQAIKDGCWFDQDSADYACEFIETFCRFSKGKRAGTRTTLIPWQRECVSRIFGWKRRDGRRRFTSVYIEIPKKNGKSYLMSAIAIYCAIADGENGAEVYLAAVNSKQARIIFDECVRMIAQCPSLQKRMVPNETTKTIAIKSTFSKISCVTSDADSQDGFDSSCTIFDELHRQKNRKLWDVFEYAGEARDQPLRLAITTAGQSRDSVCWDQHQYSQDIINGSNLDTTHLGVIYAASPEDSLDDPKTWYKANPSLGVTLKEEKFLEDLKRVRESPSQLNNFLRLRLNIWTQRESSYINQDKWNACGGPIDLEALKGKPCWGGLDLSSKKDITAFCLVFGDAASGITVLPYFWIPKEQAKERERNDSIPYTRWESEGHISLQDGAAIEYDAIEEKILELAKVYKIRGVKGDGWGSANHLLQRLRSGGLKVEFIGQGYRTLSEPIKELERLAILGKLRHGDNPILSWMNNNAVIVSDAVGNVKLHKEHPDSPKKIDGLMAMVAGLIGVTSSRPNVYSSRGVQTLDKK